MTINTIKQFIILYIATEIWFNTNSFLNFLSHIGYHSCFMFCHRAKWYSWPSFLTFWKIKWYFSDIAVSFIFFVIGINSFDKKNLENALKQSQIRLFQTVSFCPNHARCIILPQWALVYCSRNNSKIRHPTIVLIIWRHISIYIVQFTRYN